MCWIPSFFISTCEPEDSRLFGTDTPTTACPKNRTHGLSICVLQSSTLVYYNELRGREFLKYKYCHVLKCRAVVIVWRSTVILFIFIFMSFNDLIVFEDFFHSLEFGVISIMNLNTCWIELEYTYGAGAHED